LSGANTSDLTTKQRHLAACFPNSNMKSLEARKWSLFVLLKYRMCIFPCTATAAQVILIIVHFSKSIDPYSLLNIKVASLPLVSYAGLVRVKNVVQEKCDLLKESLNKF